MTEKVLIVSTEKRIEAVHFEKDECLSCTTGCAKIKNSFELSNPDNLEIKKGSIVMVEANRKAQALQGILALLIPFLCAVAGYVFAPFITGLFRKTISNDGKAVFVLLFLVLSSAVVMIVTRKHPMPGKPVIKEVV